MRGPSPSLLTVDVGTGSVRAALVDSSGSVTALEAVPHATHYPRHGWVEQRPEDWWRGAVRAIAGALSRAGGVKGIRAIVCCGQMHAPVLIDTAGNLVREFVPLWNDKRAAEESRSINERSAANPHGASPNPATSAWPGVKLHWMALHDAQALENAARLLMPKDYLNFRLTGEIAMDWTEAGSSFLSDPSAETWSPELAKALGVPSGLLPPLLRGHDVLGRVSAAAAKETGLPVGLPVFAGAGDYPAAILGSGVTMPGQLSDITGTSFLLTRLIEKPVHHPDVMNVAVATGGWGAFAVVDAAGDAIRWASRALDRETQSYEAMSKEAATVPPGAEGVIFLPYLTGERLGQGAASRAGFLGLTAKHGSAHLHRAVMEGVVLAMREAFRPIASTANLAEATEIVSAAGGAKSDLWLQIKADIFNLPVVAPVEVEAGLVGCAALGSVGLGAHADLTEAARNLVRHRPPVLPDPTATEAYAEVAAKFAAVRRITPQLNAILGAHQ